MTMSTKDYKLLAETIAEQVSYWEAIKRSSTPSLEGVNDFTNAAINSQAHSSLYALSLLALELSGRLKENNSRFDSNLFKKACNLS